MFNDLIDIMKDIGIRFATVLGVEKGKSYIMTFVSLLFYLNRKKHQSLLKERRYLKVAEILKPLMIKVYNYPEEHHHKMSQICSEDLQK